MDDRNDKRGYDAQDVRQGEIVLKKPWQRWIFGVGLFGAIVWAVLLGWFFRWYS
ncbi:MAG: hypothetical protein J0H65_11210 [Rhizobiales bacterium]|nr:hypothetical protein [Hyphomicrobiales bacterium]